MSFTVSITNDDILTALRTFILAVLPAGVEVVEAQDNRVAEPTSLDFVVITPPNRTRLATTVESWDDTNPLAADMDYRASTDVQVQIDVHGPNGADYVQTILTLFRSGYGVAVFPEGITPLYCDPQVQAPFLNGENQYENRWVSVAHIQVTPTVSTPQQFADIVTVDIALAVDLEPV